MKRFFFFSKESEWWIQMGRVPLGGSHLALCSVCVHSSLVFFVRLNVPPHQLTSLGNLAWQKRVRRHELSAEGGRGRVIHMNG